MNAALEPIPMAYRDQTIGFAKGWYCVADSTQVPADAMLPVTALDQQLIVFRTKEGKAQVADAYCPHLGAHLASFDGAIEDGEVVCPFHKWRFDTSTGKCNKIPYTDVIPPQAKLKLYPTVEQNGMVLMWHHPKDAAAEAPPFDPTQAYAEHTWIKIAERVIETTVPVRDLFENVFDTAHIQQLHRGANLPEIASVLRKPHGLEVNFEKPKVPERTVINFMQFNFSGMGGVTHIVLGEGYGFYQQNSFTPIDREKGILKIRMFIKDMGDKVQNETVGKAFAERVAFETEQDMKVLNFKKHLSRPLICAGDGPIMKWRQYSEELLAG
jgi:3-ketosteroid 9alpha-monooxygenase subunit A